MSLHHISDPAAKWIDGLAISLAGVTAFGFLQGLALVVTILSGLGSLSLIALRWHDRRKYGPSK